MSIALLRRAVAGYFADDCPLAAAAIAYYVLLSIFPLILLVITVGSNLLPPSEVERHLLDFINQYAAGSRGTLRQVVRGVGQHSTSLSLLALAGLAWSGMGIFGALRMALNQAWGVREKRTFWAQRQLEAAFALLVGGLFLLSSLASAGIDAMIGTHGAAARSTALLLRDAVAAGVALAGFTLCYELVPSHELRRWRASLVAGLAATVLFEAARWIFVAWVHGIANYSLVYGAIGAVIVFLVWAYAMASILLFGGRLAQELEAAAAAEVPAGNI